MTKRPASCRAHGVSGAAGTASAKQVTLLDPLGREEWCFEDVPKDEWEVCRLWEYAREPPSIRNICERSLLLAQGKLESAAGAAVQTQFRALFHRLERRAVLFQHGFYGFEGVGDFMEFQTPFPRPWQSLTPQQRAVLCETANWNVEKVFPIPLFRRTELPRVEGLAECKPESIVEVYGRGSVPITEYFHSGDKLRRVTPHYFYRDGCEVLGVEIDWGRATDEQLIADFTQWLRENRPPGFKHPSGQGNRKANVYAALDWLGMMRLLHRYTHAEMARKTPEAAQRFQSRDWYRERKKAREKFRELFPFLPGNEMPLSWLTKGARRR